MARVEIKTNAQLQQMARAGVITSRALDAAVAAARPGVTTAEVNAAFERTMLELGGTSNFYGYYDYPATVCTSVNHEVCLLYTSPSPRDRQKSRMPSSA